MIEDCLNYLGGVKESLGVAGTQVSLSHTDNCYRLALLF